MPGYTETMPQQQLVEMARQARQAAGLTQVEAAERLSVTQANISRAETDTSGRYLALQLRIMRELAGWRVEGPLWQITRSK